MYLDRAYQGVCILKAPLNPAYKQSESVDESTQAQIGFDELDIGAHRQA